MVRDGWYGRPPHRRQRWRCRPPNGDRPHRFCEVLPRQATSEHFCVECSTRLERWEGQAGAREYWFSAREVGHALALVAAGESYRQAAWAARRAAGRTHQRLTGGGGRLRDPNLDGQLVANWVDSLAPIVTAGELPEHWPERLALDSREFRIDRGPRAGQSFHVFCAVGHYEPGRSRIWRMAAFPRRTEADWQEFLFRHALFDHHNWARFETEARHTHEQASPRLPALTRWLDNYGEPVAAQLKTRSSLGPNSIGAVEAALHQVDRGFQGRSQSFSNRPRLNLLLDLMTLHANGQADPRRWADRLRERLHPRGGIAPHQRPHDDRRGRPSLLA